MRKGHKVEPDALYGGVAQLGEHLLCKQGVIGSIPIISTSKVSKGTEEARGSRDAKRA